jgi:hypothetical protein
MLNLTVVRVAEYDRCSHTPLYQVQDAAGKFVAGDYTSRQEAEDVLERLESQERDEQAIIDGEARYRESVLADEVGIGYANPDYLDSSDDFEGDDL